MNTMALVREPHDLYHPIFFRLETPAVKALAEHLQLWIESGITGGVIVGDARIGKTSAIEIIKQRIESQSKLNLATISTSVPSSRSRSQRVLFQEILKDFDSSVSVRKTESELKFDIINACMDAVALHDYHSDMVFLIDEAQNCSIEQLSGLAMLQDALIKNGIAGYFFLVANRNQIKPLYEQVSQSPDLFDQLMGRFFLQVYEFKTIRSRSDLQEVLVLFDRIKISEDSSLSITYHYLAEAQKTHWKLKSTSALLWSTFLKVKPKDVTHWKMKHLIGTLAPLLIDYLPRYGLKAINEDMIRMCIEASSLIPSSTFQDLSK